MSSDAIRQPSSTKEHWPSATANGTVVIQLSVANLRMSSTHRRFITIFSFSDHTSCVPVPQGLVFLFLSLLLLLPFDFSFLIK